ncbi:hypothetical protein METBIDRAFT_37244 [Metschnikowia bicuspidata var. bicuspidata NRRL YB-4993]|uniref:Iron transport multicopper oxidase FET3 n=1 Tax=Metschnikowia bicuspidata var. bicuspidata NRRL YB-4993 TaxID=869754 RepID=A0A1A0HIW8_9ASCO|nr:hypothetical protein METBIDRAFT_37244 [Metschnikowia bicuspidata var. bicuspidata NRRL YB-4993]OBA23783.1 hypothetical protein METBIDRAFT_37244 [Metschnikowia bicuspidata var. bicuspidata NRRL YB-4993]
MRAFSVLLFSLLASFAAAANETVHTWYFETTWVDANPDGCFERPVIGFNNSWPLPILRVNKGDRVNLYLTNGFTDRNTTLHFHGMFQNGTSQMDGPEMVTQCPIAPGDTMLYNFTVADQVGTFWYHSHTTGQYGDGMRGVFVIDETDDYPFDFDEEVVLSVGEWYHDDADTLIPEFLNLYNPTGAEPIPKNLLFNDTRNNSWVVEPDTTYLMRIVNVGGFVSQYLYMEDHEFTVVAVDGIYVQPNTTEMIYITAAQRYDVLITTKNDTSKNYAFMSKFDETMLDLIPDDLLLNSTNYIIYDESLDKPDQYYVDSIDDYLDDFYLVPESGEELLDDSDHLVTLDVMMNNLMDGVNYAFFNNITYTVPKVPILATAISAGEFATNSYIYGNVHPIVLAKDEIVDIVINNEDTGKHPFHLHGHVFQLIARGEGVDDDQDPVAYDPDNHDPFPEYPMIRDTVYVNPQSYIVLRFKADNPGVWFFHCHIEWHLDQGLAVAFIEAPTELQEKEEFTENWKAVCDNSNVPYDGNAAANSVDFMDLTGANVQAADLPAGFTARGIVALVFSCVAGFLGMAAIAFYGMSESNLDLDEQVIRDLDVKLPEEDEIELEVEAESYENAHKVGSSSS